MKLLLGLLAAALLTGIGVLVWFSATHQCARSHPEQHMTCTSFHLDDSISTTDCRPYTATVCDEWVRR